MPASLASVAAYPAVASTPHTLSRGTTADSSTNNLVGVKNMIMPQESKEYERIFAGAYDDAKRVCKEAGLVPA